MAVPEQNVERIRVVKGHIATIRSHPTLTPRQREALLQTNYRELADLCEGRITCVDNQPPQT